MQHSIISGTWTGVYHSNAVPPTNVSLTFYQLHNHLHQDSVKAQHDTDSTIEAVVGIYLSENGAIGTMRGTISGNELNLSATQVTPGCEGEFSMPGIIDGDTFKWQFKGNDCLGVEDGSGTATRTKA